MASAVFPQPRSVSGALLETQLMLMGPLMAAVSQANQLQVLQVMPPSWLHMLVTTSTDYRHMPSLPFVW